MSGKTFDKAEYFTIMWTLFALALAFLIARIAIRLKLYGRLLMDDGFVILAITCLLAANITLSVEYHKTAILQDVQTHHAPKPFGYKDVTDAFEQYQWAVAYLFFTSIWAVKGSFLAFYDGLTARLTIYRWAWWLVIVITILTYIGSLFAYGFLDGRQFKTNLRNEAINYQFSVDLTTDVLITMIPLILALRSKVATKQKLALAGVFSLSFVITIIAIVRYALNAPSRGALGPTWLQIWSCIEQSVSIIVVCLASFRTFIITNQKNSSSDKPYNVMNTFLARKQKASADRAGFSHLNPHGTSSVRRPESHGSMDVELLKPVHYKSPA